MLRKIGYDRQLSDHTHAGQYFPMSLMVCMFQPYVSGLNRHGDTQIYVSRGTGDWGATQPGWLTFGDHLVDPSWSLIQTIEATIMRAIWNGKTIAQTDDTVVVEGNHYFPRDSIVNEHFEASDHQTRCPWKGTASYFTVVVDGKRNENAAWHYPTPKSAAAQIAGRVAFWKGVEVRD